MFELIAGISLFVTAAIIANVLQSKFRLSYTAHPTLFTIFYISCIAVTLWLCGYTPTPVLVAGMISLSCLYIVGVKCLVMYWKPMQFLFKADTVPSAYYGIVSPQTSGQIVKVTEVALQDVSAWLIVGGLLALVSSSSAVAIIFTLVVLLLHVPGLWMFGKTYGTYFLITSTTLAFVVPFLYQIGTQGFLWLYATHLGGYVFMYLLMGYLGRQTR